MCGRYYVDESALKEIQKLRGIWTGRGRRNMPEIYVLLRKRL